MLRCASSICEVPLCTAKLKSQCDGAKTCFERWHTCKDLRSMHRICYNTLRDSIVNNTKVDEPKNRGNVSKKGGKKNEQVNQREQAVIAQKEVPNKLNECQLIRKVTRRTVKMPELEKKTPTQSKRLREGHQTQTSTTEMQNKEISTKKRKLKRVNTCPPCKVKVSKEPGRCSISGGTFTGLCPYHKCCSCKAGVHNLCAKSHNLTSDLNELNMFCSEKCKKDEKIPK